MATIAQQPNKNNVAYGYNVWVLSGLGAADRYVLRVKIGGNVVATFKQPANPSGEGFFDVSKVLQSYLEPYFAEETVHAVDTDNAHLTYQVDYGSETGNTVTIDGTSATKFVINAYDNWRNVNADLSDFIPAPTSELCESNSNINAVYNRGYNFLTNYPEAEYTVRSDEYKTLSFYNRIENFNDGTNWGPNEAPFFVRITGGANDVVYALSDANGSSVRTDCTDFTCTFDDDNIIATIGIGPANIATLMSAPYDDYRVRIYSYNHCMTTTISDCTDYSEIINDGYLGDVIYSANFKIDDSCSKFEPITVSFLNQYGVKDFYTFDRRNTRRVNTNRQNYDKTLGSWSDTSFAIRPYDRGRTTFSSAIETVMTLQTNWLTDATSEWLQELYTSPSVLIYVDGQWEPVTITTQTYEEKTEARNNILYQHEIQVRYSNNKKVQRG